MRILAIESTCDETAAAVVVDKSGGTEVLAQTVASSAEITSKYGGIVPEIVAREQVACAIPVISETLGKYQGEIDAVAVAYGPGLVGSLLIGIETAKALALAWDKPLIKVNHMVAHVLANWIVPTTSQSGEQVNFQLPTLPAIGLVVSGGHTDLILLKNETDWEWIGGTRDDAAGEAFDKGARAMGLPYPGGPMIQKAIDELDLNTRKPDWLKLPRPMIHEKNLEMSFSGLKTAVVDLMTEKKTEIEAQNLSGLIAKEFNEAVVEVLVTKSMAALEKYSVNQMILAGGVAANKLLRETLSKRCTDIGIKLSMPEFRYCGDNAAMIGACALMRQDTIDPTKLRPDPALTVI